MNQIRCLASGERGELLFWVSPACWPAGGFIGGAGVTLVVLRVVHLVHLHLNVHLLLLLMLLLEAGRRRLVAGERRRLLLLGGRLLAI